MDWIDFSIEQPKENQIVWALTDEHQGAIMVQYFYVKDEDNSGWAFAHLYDVPTYHNGEWQGDADWDDNYNVKYWQPLPEPIE